MAPTLLLATLVLAFAAAPVPAQQGATQSATPAVGSTPVLEERIRSRIERNGSATAVIAVGGERLHASTDLPRFYERGGFQPTWVTSDGPTPLADSLIEAIAGAEREGLRPEDYHLSRVRSLLATGNAPYTLVDVDLLLTDAFLTYGSHLVSGRVDPVAMHPEWTARGREADLVQVLEGAVASGAVGQALESLLPEQPEYSMLRSTLAHYREIAGSGGFPEIPGRPLRPGERDPAVPRVREWTRLTGDLAAGAAVPTDPELLDPALEAAVKRLQERHGMVRSGVVNLQTSAVMNVPVEQRIRQIEIAMERWRWLPRDLGHRHIRVNIAGLYVHVLEGDSVAFASRVMVGQRYRMTPVFSDRLTYLVLNPSWTIPSGILEQDKLPLIRRDRTYLKANRIRVLDTAGREVDPAAIDWSTVTGRTSYRFRMDPGPENPLGNVKFMFPNVHSIYLHDTPSREFDRGSRDFSSGCIRVENPMDLAEYLLRDDPQWTRARIDAAVGAGGEQTIPLRSPLPVHLLYWTAWADIDGAVHFSEDIYDRDDALDRALREPPPSH